MALRLDRNLFLAALLLVLLCLWLAAPARSDPRLVSWNDGVPDWSTTTYTLTGVVPCVAPLNHDAATGIISYTVEVADFDSVLIWRCPRTFVCDPATPSEGCAAIQKLWYMPPDWPTSSDYCGSGPLSGVVCWAECATVDFNGDGVIGSADFGWMVASLNLGLFGRVYGHWGESCP